MRWDLTRHHPPPSGFGRLSLAPGVWLPGLIPLFGSTRLTSGTILAPGSHPTSHLSRRPPKRGLRWLSTIHFLDSSLQPITLARIVERPDVFYICLCGKITEHEPDTCGRCYRRSGWMRLELDPSKRVLLEAGAQLATMTLDWDQRDVTAEYQRTQLRAWWDRLRRRLEQG